MAAGKVLSKSSAQLAVMVVQSTYTKIVLYPFLSQCYYTAGYNRFEKLTLIALTIERVFSTTSILSALHEVLGLLSCSCHIMAKRAITPR